MLGILDNISNFFASIWQLIWNSLQLLIDAFQLCLTMMLYTNSFLPWLPSILALSMSLVIGIFALRFMCLK